MSKSLKVRRHVSSVKCTKGASLSLAWKGGVFLIDFQKRRIFQVFYVFFNRLQKKEAVLYSVVFFVCMYVTILMIILLVNRECSRGPYKLYHLFKSRFADFSVENIYNRRYYGKFIVK